MMTVSPFPAVSVNRARSSCQAVPLRSFSGKMMPSMSDELPLRGGEEMPGAHRSCGTGVLSVTRALELLC